MFVGKIAARVGWLLLRSGIDSLHLAIDMIIDIKRMGRRDEGGGRWCLLCVLVMVHAIIAIIIGMRLGCRDGGHW